MDIDEPDPKLAQPKAVVVPTRGASVGFSATAARPGETCLLEVSGYHTVDEGLSFYTLLEAFNEYVNATGLSRSCIDRMLVCITRTESHIYANDQLPMIARMRVKRAVDAKEAVFRDDIAGITQVDFPGVSPPSGCGFLLLLSVGWRKGMCFDLCPLAPDTRETSQEAFDNVKHMGGMILAHLHFTEMFLLSNSDWGRVLGAGWFPFVLLPQDLWNELFMSIRKRWDLAPVEQKIHESWMRSCDDRLASWRANKHFAGHMDFLERAVRAYREEDWLTVISVAAPRAEGLIRRAFGAWGKQRRVLDKLAENLKRQEHVKSLLFPDRLRQYFDKVFFRFTKFSSPDLPSSRHTLAHGLVNGDRLTRKEALTLLLLIDHLLYCLPMEKQDA